MSGSGGGGAISAPCGMDTTPYATNPTLLMIIVGDEQILEHLMQWSEPRVLLRSSGNVNVFTFRPRAHKCANPSSVRVNRKAIKV